MDTNQSKSSHVKFKALFGGCNSCAKQVLVFAFLVALQTQMVSTNWMYMAMSSVGLDDHDTGQCRLVTGLVLEQMRICEDNREAMPCVGLGVGLGLSECKYQFAFDRWNCTTPSQRQPVLSKGTKETAFAYAVTSAGVVHAVTAACSAGNITECTCDMSRQGMETSEGWRWGGCSDNVDYGVYFARTFIDSPDRIKKSLNEKDAIALMNLHNNHVGRQIVKDGLRRKCRCHGVSGSCAVKTCWNTMAPFREIGDILKTKYAVSIELTSRQIRRLGSKSKRMRRKVSVREDELVYVKKSPDYCKRSVKRGIVGTKGRECKLGTSGPESCQELCCDRGYNTRTEKTLERCDCTFVWCCEVVCKVCETVTQRHYCK